MPEKVPQFRTKPFTFPENTIKHKYKFDDGALPGTPPALKRLSV